MTADELFLLPSDNLRHELVKGELVTMTPASSEHGRIGMRIALRVSAFIEKHRLGETFNSDTGFIISRDPDTVRAPDFAFVTRERMSQEKDSKRFFPSAPDLAVEVVSPSDSFSEVVAKAHEYLAAGCREVWVADPRTRTITIYRSAGDVIARSEKDALDCSELLPGFSCTVAELFSVGS